MFLRASKLGSVSLIIGSTDGRTAITGLTSTTAGTFSYRRPEFPGTYLRNKTMSPGSWVEIGQGIYFVSLSAIEIGSKPGQLFYIHRKGGAFKYYGAADVLNQFEDGFSSRLGSILGRIPGTTKQASAGTFSYALINAIGTHLQKSVDTLLLGRIPGSVKQANAGTFSYVLINAIGTHLQKSVDTLLLGRTPGTVKQANAGTFSYPKIGSISKIELLLNNRVTGTITSTTKGPLGIGTLLNRIIGTAVTRSRLGSTEGAGFASGTHSLVQIRNNSAGGSAPGYIGSAVWSKKPTNFTTGDTFGWIFQRMLHRSEGGIVAASVSQIFSSEEKDKLFKWIDAMFQRLKAIEDLTAKLSSEFVKNIVKDLSTAQNEVKIIIKKFFAEDFKESKAIKQDVRLIIDSLQHTLGLQKKISGIEIKLSELNNLISKAASPDQIVKIVNGADKTSELKALINQAMNISADVKELSNKIIEMEAAHLEGSALTDKAILALLPPETLKNLLEKDKK